MNRRFGTPAGRGSRHRRAGFAAGAALLRTGLVMSTTPSGEELARREAQLSGERAELTSKRTETSTTHVNPDGTLTAETYAGPVRSRARTVAGRTSTPNCRTRAHHEDLDLQGVPEVVLVSRRLLAVDAAFAIVLALAATVWVYADPYTDLETRAILPRIAAGAVLSVGLSAWLMARGGRTERGIGWPAIALRVPVSLHFLWSLLPQITSELL